MPQIDFDEVVQPTLVGVTRALIFMGLGVNASLDQRLTDYRLAELAHIDFVPREVSPEKLNEFKSEFRNWVVSNGLRELIETWDVFLDRLYVAALQCEHWNASQRDASVESQAYEQRARAFCDFGTPAKFRKLSSEFGIELEFQPEIESIKKARNCLTHRLGLVKGRDANSEQGLRVMWRAPELYGVNADGSEFVPSLESFPIDFPVDSPVMHRHGTRERMVAIGQRLELAAAELKEICYTFRIAIMQAQESFVALVTRMGGTFNTSDHETQTPAPE